MSKEMYYMSDSDSEDDFIEAFEREIFDNGEEDIAYVQMREQIKNGKVRKPLRLQKAATKLQYPLTPLQQQSTRLQYPLTPLHQQTTPLQYPLTPLQQQTTPLHYPSRPLVPQNKACYKYYARQVRDDLQDFNRCMQYANYQRNPKGKIHALEQCNQGLYKALRQDHRDLRKCMSRRHIVY